MRSIWYDILSNSENLSSSRIINFSGMVVGTIIIIYHSIWLENLSYDVYGVYLAYAAGTYGLSKWAEGRNNNGYSTNRYKDYDYSESKHSVYDNPDLGDDTRF